MQPHVWLPPSDCELAGHGTQAALMPSAATAFSVFDGHAAQFVFDASKIVYLAPNIVVLEFSVYTASELPGGGLYSSVQNIAGILYVIFKTLHILFWYNVEARTRDAIITSRSTGSVAANRALGVQR